MIEYVAIDMIKNFSKIEKLMEARTVAQERIGKMSKPELKRLEVQLDVEHAYYSSTLEGSRLDRKTFDELAKKENV